MGGGRILRLYLENLKRRDLFYRMASIVNYGYGSYSKQIDGVGNHIVIGESTFLKGTKFRIIGNNNTITIGKKCYIGKGCSFWMEGNNISITIGDRNSFTCICHLNAQEDGSSIKIGNDCMFSNNIIVRTSDSHPIYDLQTNQRINPAKNVIIGNHVWIAPQSIIMKGAEIANGAIIGSRTFVTKKIPENSLAVGAPAKVVKTNVSWSRENIINH